MDNSLLAGANESLRREIDRGTSIAAGAHTLVSFVLQSTVIGFKPGLHLTT